MVFPLELFPAPVFPTRTSLSDTGHRHTEVRGQIKHDYSVTKFDCAAEARGKFSLQAKRKALISREVAAFIL